MSLALYRTYRPGTFADVIGQDHVTQPLMRALAADRTHHAYLFSGPRGCGKTSSARILARTLNCIKAPAAEPCGECASCLDLAPNGPGSLDVIELDAASNRGIDQARELRDQAMYAPAGARYRIYIIDEAHQLTSEAANALLKLVEEPPPHLRFIFATTEPEKLLGTIRSRTHHYPFRLVPTSVLQSHLAKVCEAEGIAADPAALALAAKAGAGSVRDALSVLGQLVGGATEAGITYDDAVKQLGFTADSLLDNVITALAANDSATMFLTIDGVVTGGHDPRRFATDLLERLRDLIILLAAPEAAEHGLISQPADRIEVLKQQAQSLGMAALSRAADLVSDGLTALRGATTPRLHLELLAARLLVAAGDADPAAMATRLAALERQVATGAVAAPSAAAAPPAPAPKPTPPPKLSDVAPATAKPATAKPVETPVAEAPVDAAPTVEAPVAAPVVEAPVIATPTTPAPEAVDLPAIVALWPAAVEAIKTLPDGGRIAWVSAQSAVPVKATATTLTLAFNNMGPLNMAKGRDLGRVFAAAVAQVMGRSFDIEMVLDTNVVLPEAPAQPSDMTPKPVAKAAPVAAAAEQTDESLNDEEFTDKKGIDLVVEVLGGVIMDDPEAKP